jgi:hypothetical protein
LILIKAALLPAATALRQARRGQRLTDPGLPGAFSSEVETGSR